MIKNTALAVAMALLATTVSAEERFYIYISYEDAAGTYYRQSLDCLDNQCKVKNNDTVRATTLSADQRTELLGAFEAETKTFTLKSDEEPGDRLVKLKYRYMTLTRDLSVSRRLLDKKLAEVSPEMLKAIKANIGFDLLSLVPPKGETGEDKSTAPKPDV
jgi:hypothetical protein